MLKSVPIVPAIQAFVIILYCVNRVPESSLLIESWFLLGGVGGGGGAFAPPCKLIAPPLESGNLLVKQLDNVGMLACKF